MTETAEMKKALRKQAIATRRALSAEERSAASARIAERIAAMPEYRAASTVMLYRAMPDEADMQPLTELPVSAGKRFVYPRCTSGTEMICMLPGGWREGPFGIQEPDAASSEEIPPESVDFIVCPGAAFDDQRRRLGMGGGYYDRFLPRCTNAAVVMAAFEIQRVPAVPCTENDIAMDHIVTEKAVY